MEKLFETLVLESDLLLMVVALWVFVKAMQPLYRGVAKLISQRR